jgi:hypothetical protein
MAASPLHIMGLKVKISKIWREIGKERINIDDHQDSSG